MRPLLKTAQEIALKYNIRQTPISLHLLLPLRTEMEIGFQIREQLFGEILQQ